MSDEEKVHKLGRTIEFTVDGQPFSTTERRQAAADLLRLAGLDAALYDLGELHGERPQTKRFADDEIVTIRPGSRYVSIRQSADVA